MGGETKYHNLTWKSAVDRLHSDPEKGLHGWQMGKRKEKFGRNVLPEEKQLSGLRIFIEQFRSPLIYVLMIAGTVTLLFEEYTDSFVIFGAVFLNTLVGFFQERKASSTLVALKKIVKHEAEVIREGHNMVVSSEDLVPGDIIVLKPGFKVPADARVISCFDLKVNEMALTGEWLSAQKSTKVLPESTSLADRDNMVYMGTVVESGKAKCLVIAIGTRTEIGKVALMVKKTKEEKTPYQEKIASLSRIIGAIIALICLFIFIEGMATGGKFMEMFTTAVAVAVASIPEGLPVSVTVILALGMQRILKKNGLVRKLTSAETLGSTSIICTDKTGTLTEGRMKMARIMTAGEILNKRKRSEDETFLLKIAALSNQAFVENPEAKIEDWIVRGKPTDKALLLGAAASGIRRENLERGMELLKEIIFDPVEKYVARVFRKGDKTIFYVSGAPEIILDRSLFFTAGGEEERLEEKNIFTEKLDEMASHGMRTIALAYKETDGQWEGELDNLVFAGFIGLEDPVRPEAKEAISACKEAGMRIVIVTGDHRLTAKAVAEKIGFDLKEENIMEGKDLDSLPKKELEERIKEVSVFARVEPRHKMMIVDFWQQKGEVVAMTGDGVNDAPALKKADVGVALGSGTEVAKESSDLVLLDDRFSIIVAAVQEGRAILDNIRKVITYLLSDSFTEIILVGFSIVAGLPLPVTAIQILWVNLMEDGLPNIALAFEKKEKDVMRQKPGRHNTPLLTKEMKFIIFIIGMVTDLVLLFIFSWMCGQDYPIEYVRTVVFAILGIDSLFYVFSCKSLRKNIWRINIFDNKFLFVAWLSGVLTLLISLYLPLSNRILGTVPLPLAAWWAILGLGLLNLILIEAAKYYFIFRKKTNE